MNQYMVEVHLPAYMSQAFMELIPQQREFVNRMFKDGIITAYSLSIDRSKLWVTFDSNSTNEVEYVIKQFPVYHHIQYSIVELAFHESADVVVPSISLN